MSEPHEPTQERPASGEPEAAPPLRYFSAETEPAGQQAYRALSLLALIAFGVCALYGGLVVLLGVVGLFTGKPMLLPAWSLLIPLLGVVLCLLARSRVRQSEGTLAGEGLIRWGIVLALFVGVGYWAYYAAIFMAVRQQARTFTESWLETLRDDNRRQAVFLMIPPLQRVNRDPNDPELIKEVEGRMGASDPAGTARAVYFRLLENNAVRMVLLGGPESKFEFKGVRAWEYIRGGYEVSLDMDIITPEGTHHSIITVHGSTAPNNEYEQRQWYVVSDPSKTGIRESALNDVGKRRLDLAGHASQLVQGIPPRLLSGDRLDLFLLTFPDAELERNRKAISLARARALLGAAAAEESELLQQYHNFLQGGLVSVDPGAVFWGGEENNPNEIRALIVRETREQFSHPSERGVRPDLPQTPPLWVIRNDRLVLQFDFRLGEPGRYSLEGILEVEGNLAALDSPAVAPDWRLAGLRILAGRKLQPPGPRQPRRLGG